MYQRVLFGIRNGIVLSCCLAMTATAQAPKNPMGGPTTGSPTPNLPGQPGTFPGATTGSPDIARPVYLSGKVVLDDGTPPTDSVTIQLQCSGTTPRNVGFTNNKGQFSVDLTDRRNNSQFADASQPGGGWDVSPTNNPTSLGNSNAATVAQSGIGGRNGFLGCELLAVLPGFRSDHVDLFNRHALDNPEIGTMVLHRLGNVEGFTISATTAMAPKDAKKAFEKGRTAEKKEKWDEAETEFQKAADAYPKFAAAWYELGYAQQKRNNVEAARKSYARSIEADPKFINPYGQLAMLAVREQKWDEVADNTSQLLHLNPVDFPIDWYFNSLANLQLQKLDVAEKSAREGINADHQHRVPKLNELLGIILAQKHDYSGAVENLRAYLLTSPQGDDADVAKKQLAEIEKMVQPPANKD